MQIYYVSSIQNPRKGKIKTESGAWIPATYKSDRYAQWRDKTKVAQNMDYQQEEGDNDNNNPGKIVLEPNLAGC